MTKTKRKPQMPISSTRFVSRVIKRLHLSAKQSAAASKRDNSAWVQGWDAGRAAGLLDAVEITKANKQAEP